MAEWQRLLAVTTLIVTVSYAFGVLSAVGYIEAWCR